MLNMKKILSLLTLAILGCSTPEKPQEHVVTVDSAKTIPSHAGIDNSQYYTQEDSINLVIEEGDTFQYSKEDYNKIVDLHPEFFEDYAQDPYQLYDRYGAPDFSSEVGQDIYHVLYAHFLKQRNGIKENELMRKKLIEAYGDINRLFQTFQYGGTYFAHQYRRIIGYAEYSISIYVGQKDSFEKKYDITKQKALYIQSLRQLIADETSNDNGRYFGERKDCTC